jgi:hypothetical protein
MQPFRSDIDALEARHAALAAEVADRVRARDEAASMLAEARTRQRNDEVFADIASGGPARRQRYVVLGFIGTFGVGLGILGLAHLAHERRDTREHRKARILAQFESFANQACACTDQTCTMQVSDAMQRWATQLVKDEDQPDGTWIAKMQTLSERMGQCMVRTLSSGQPPVD